MDIFERFIELQNQIKKILKNLDKKIVTKSMTRKIKFTKIKNFV